MLVDVSVLVGLLLNPRERLDVEIKSWLDLSTKRHRAKLAQAAIALANHGGGTIILGLKEDKSQPSGYDSTNCPFGRYTSDQVNSAIGKYADPTFDSVLHFASHPDTGFEHAFVVIPGKMTAPVMTKKGSEIFSSLQCFIRKPAPIRSEVPHTSQEWRDLLSACVRANHDEMLDSIRAIVQGRPDLPDSNPTESDSLMSFIEESRMHWRRLVEELPSDHVSRFSRGYYELAFSILGVDQINNVSDIRDLLHKTSERAFSHREPGVVNDYRVVPIDDGLQLWIGDPNHPTYRESSSQEYWRVRQDMKFYLIRGYEEDLEYQQRGKTIRVEYSIARTYEVVEFAARIASLLGENAKVLVWCNYEMLNGRRLSRNSRERDAAYGNDYLCHVSAKAIGPKPYHVSDLRNNPSEAVHGFLSPLLGQFNFYKLNPAIVAAIVGGSNT